MKKSLISSHFAHHRPRDKLVTYYLNAYAKGQNRKKYFNFLEKLRESGETNVYGAVPYLQDNFRELRYALEDAKRILLDWFKTFEEKGANSEC